MSQSLIIALAVSFVVALLEWRLLSKIHGRKISSMREHYRAEARVAAELLSQCRHQVIQLKSDLSNATALSARLSFKVVSNSAVPHAQGNDFLSHGPHPSTVFQPTVFSDTKVEEADPVPHAQESDILSHRPHAPTAFQTTVFADTTIDESDRRMLG